MLHPRANVSRLYLPRDHGGRGLTLIEETIETEEYRLSDFVKETNKNHNRLLKSVKKKGTKKEQKDNIKEHRTKEWTEKPLHGQYPTLVADTSHNNTYK